MPKTRNAFALKDFDRARILQRPYFKDFNFDKNLTDEKILSSLSAQIGDSVAELERKNATLRKIYARLEKYSLFITRHAQRISQYIQRQERHSIRGERGGKMLLEYLSEIFPQSTYFLGAVFVYVKNSESILRRNRRRSFAQRLKLARERAGLSRRDLAERLGYTENGYGKFETGRNEPNLTALAEMSQFLNTSADWLLGLK